MRLFVAVDIDERTRAQLATTREAIHSVIAKARVPPRVTWVKDESAHVTLRFIGETPEDTVDAIKQSLLNGFQTSPFTVEWQRVGTFPAGRHPRVIWIGPAADSDAMTVLAGEVNTRLEPIVGLSESRPFKAHLTMGRVKEPGKEVDWPKALAAVRWRPTITRIDHVTLYSSRTSPNGPTYTALARICLG